MAERITSLELSELAMNVSKRETGVPGSRFSFAHYRLPAKEYPAVFAEGVSLAGRSLVLWYRKVDEDAPTRFGVATSKRTLHEAVWRSRARRLLREAFRKVRPEIIGGVACVLVARRMIRERCAYDVEKDLRRLLQKAGLLQKAS